MSPRLQLLLCLLAAGVGFQGVVFLKDAPNLPEPANPLHSAGGLDPDLPASPAARGGVPAPGVSVKRGQPRSLREIVNRIEGTSPADTKLVLLEAINRLDPTALIQLLAEAAASPNLFRTLSTDFEYAARRLSEIAPEKAAALWREGGKGVFGAEALLRPWANRDPSAFVAWSVGLSPNEQKALGELFKQMARANPRQFAEIAPQLAQSPGGAAGARGAIGALLEKEGTAKEAQVKVPEAALSYAKSLPEGALRRAALVEVAQKCDLRKVDLAAHPEMREALASLGPLEAYNIAKKFVDTADKLPHGALRERAFVGQISAAASKDPKSAAKKVEALAGSADYPAAVRGFVEATATVDPAAAVDWALSIGLQGGQRTAALEKAAMEYFVQKPDAARKWVASAPLSAEEYFLLTGFRR